MGDKESTTEIHFACIKTNKQKGDGEKESSNIVSCLSYIAKGEDVGKQRLEFDLASGKLVVSQTPDDEAKQQSTDNTVVTRMAASGFYFKVL